MGTSIVVVGSPAGDCTVLGGVESSGVLGVAGHFLGGGYSCVLKSRRRLAIEDEKKRRKVGGRTCSSLLIVFVKLIDLGTLTYVCSAKRNMIFIATLEIYTLQTQNHVHQGPSMLSYWFCSRRGWRVRVPLFGSFDVL